ncbi:hypothetical protein AMTRI_Chr11g151630 [Amborella trichopoda]
MLPEGSSFTDRFNGIGSMGIFFYGSYSGLGSSLCYI